jgi:hypothetical protein
MNADLPEIEPIGEPGFEPRLTGSEPVVLPLHHSPGFHRKYTRAVRGRQVQTDVPSVVGCSTKGSGSQNDAINAIK